MARSGPCSHLGVFPPLCAALFLTACVPNLDFMNDPAYRSVAVAHRVMVEPWSRSPLFAEDTVESELRLDGDWSETSSTATWTFAASEGNDYRLTVNEDGYAAIFKATIVFLGQHRFLDLRYELPPGLQTSPPDAEAAFQPDSRSGAIGDVHVFFKIRAADRQILLAPMSQEWLEAGLESRRPEIRHAETSEGPVILEASTEDLRGFVVQFAADPAAFPAVEPGGHGFSLRKLGPS